MEAFSRGVTLARRQGLQGGSIPLLLPAGRTFPPRKLRPAGQARTTASGRNDNVPLAIVLER